MRGARKREWRATRASRRAPLSSPSHETPRSYASYCGQTVRRFRRTRRRARTSPSAKRRAPSRSARLTSRLNRRPRRGVTPRPRPAPREARRAARPARARDSTQTSSLKSSLKSFSVSRLARSRRVSPRRPRRARRGGRLPRRAPLLFGTRLDTPRVPLPRGGDAPRPPRSPKTLLPRRQPREPTRELGVKGHTSRRTSRTRSRSRLRPLRPRRWRGKAPSRRLGSGRRANAAETRTRRGAPGS